MVKAKDGWVPNRQDIIWIDCNPQTGKEMRDMHPFLVLSPKSFNEKTSLVVGLPMTTASYNASNPFAVVAGVAKGSKAGLTSYVLCQQPKSFDWRMRKASPHPDGQVSDDVLHEALAILNQIIQVVPL